jgi:hypothetical protein
MLSCKFECASIHNAIQIFPNFSNFEKISKPMFIPQKCFFCIKNNLLSLFKLGFVWLSFLMCLPNLFQLFQFFFLNLCTGYQALVKIPDDFTFATWDCFTFFPTTRARAKIRTTKTKTKTWENEGNTWGGHNRSEWRDNLEPKGKNYFHSPS